MLCAFQHLTEFVLTFGCNSYANGTRFGQLWPCCDLLNDYWGHDKLRDAGRIEFSFGPISPHRLHYVKSLSRSIGQLCIFVENELQFVYRYCLDCVLLTLGFPKTPHKVSNPIFKPTTRLLSIDWNFPKFLFVFYFPVIPSPWYRHRTRIKIDSSPLDSLPPPPPSTTATKESAFFT